MKLGELMVFSVVSTQTGTNNRMKLGQLMVFSIVSNKLGQIVNVQGEGGMAHHLEYFPLLERGTMIALGLLFFFHTPGWQEQRQK